MNNEIFEKFKSVRVYKENDKFSVHKPILLLYALSQFSDSQDRMLRFIDINNMFKKCFLTFHFEGKSENSHYPFGKLENDEI